ncbi:MAG: acyl-CoA thioesterase [Chitinophagales bacterium]
MSRIQINFPAQAIFSTEIPVRITDLNYGNHLGNDAMLSILHEARIQFLKSFGYSEMDVEGVGIIMSDAGIQFKTEAFYGDILKIDIGVGEYSRVGFDIFYNVSCEQRIVALAKTGIVFYDYERKKIAAVPVKFAEKFTK